MVLLVMSLGSITFSLTFDGGAMVLWRRNNCYINLQICFAFGLIMALWLLYMALYIVGIIPRS